MGILASYVFLVLSMRLVMMTLGRQYISAGASFIFFGSSSTARQCMLQWSSDDDRLQMFACSGSEMSTLVVLSVEASMTMTSVSPTAQQMSLFASCVYELIYIMYTALIISFDVFATMVVLLSAIL
jgi:hypothetical protein